MHKTGLGRITENTPKYQGVVVYSMSDMPLVSWCSFHHIQLTQKCYCQGFGVAAKSTGECRKADPMNIICFHQADIGEYVRSEETLT